ncbi:MAG: hypothetical protein PHW18_08755 [Sulfuricurvum sp.]|uniref:hypothetical protein n=1 Tax=Sulfuricurvum sp. TaxID=2025608 RepID=UPI0026230613|nr:hypothetical protein [Sulfuricurvum sp.]MDD2829647.1 hypothetical protein [Sulfuricurvum sp.]MDD4948685.1 hypothetical protein [Sulfuricurvum sp.]
MKILMIDNNSLQVQTRKMFIEEELACTIDLAFTSQEIQTVLFPTSHSLVIIDHTTPSCQNCIDYILSINPQQSILVVSDAPKCVIPKCEDCLANHNIRRLSNPTSINNIIRMIKGFEGYHCDHYKASSK